MITPVEAASSKSHKSTVNVAICKFFNRTSGCRFGDKCRYRHELEILQTTLKVDADISNTKTGRGRKPEKFPEKSEISNNSGQKALESENGESARDQDGAIQNKKEQIRKPVCRYFRKSGFCRHGDRCRFFHQSNVTKSRNSDTHGELLEQIPDQTQIESKSIQQVTSHIPHKRPENVSDKLSELTDESLQYLQAVEIEQLKKRFGNGDLNITEEDKGTVCMFTINPTDPDWPYDINEVELNVTFPRNYPKEIFKAEVIDDDDQFPANFLRYINNDIEKYLQEHAEAQKIRDTPDLLFRPFLRWLDRNLENLFTKTLKQIKFDVEARSAGLEFITFDKKHGDNKTAHENKKAHTRKTSDQENKDIKPECDNMITELRTRQITNDSDSDDEKRTSENEDTSAMFQMIDARKSGNSKKGTEIRFRGMELHENTATVRATSLTFTVQCSRCKNREEMPNVKESTQVVLTCSKCSNAQSVVFTSSELVHQHSATLAYINPQRNATPRDAHIALLPRWRLYSCLPVDLILTECQMVLGCLNCSKETSMKGINYGSTKNVWCHHCHNKLDIKVEAARFHQLQPDKETDGKIKTVELKKPNLKSKDPLIKSGQALPDNGTCKHYKKSYRWMRFPCCGKCYPCDKCHEEVGDGHEMEQATRMICGFCSKEQENFLITFISALSGEKEGAGMIQRKARFEPCLIMYPWVFSQKGCVSCKASVTAIHTSHWEGGKGCRNKIKMSRGDDKKYTNKNKTVSRHATKVESQKKK